MASYWGFIRASPFRLSSDDGTGGSYLIVLQSTGGERDFYYAEVYLPAIDALK